MEYIAHIKDDDASDGVNRIEETVTEHSEKVAKLAEKYGQPLRIPHIVCIGAMLHDVGKLNKDFSEYIRGSSRYERGDIDHSYAGARYLEEYTAGTNGYVRYTAQLIARIIISHHGLHDWWTDKCKNYYKSRCSKQERYKEINDNIKQFVSDNELNNILIDATNEYSKIDEKIQQICNSEKNTISLVTKAFYFGMLERLAESCLIDADRTATAEFMEGIEITEPSEDEIQRNWLDMKQRLDNKLSKFSGSDSLISKLRMNISDRCCAFAKNDVGISQLIVPTGGGKTLSALRFAIEYAVEHKVEHKKERIFYISPFMSILEQNGDVIREIVGDDNYLEHHSDMYCKIVGDKSKSKEKVAEELEDYELRCQHWDKPLIATTMLQFMDTLFSSRTETIRRMHRFTNSVIIIDEVQSIPVKCVYIFNLAMNFLANFMGCTIVLCTATQPTLEQCKYPIMLDKESSMTGDYKQDFVDFARTKITPLLDNKGGYSYGEAAAVCMDKYRENGNILFVVNTKDAAAKVYSEVSNLNKEESFQAKLIHLSTNMCPAHRRNAIEDIRDMLNKGQPVICITTQLIEAGVDISFKCVIRSHAGMENVAQAAGRCNRNGEKVCGDVYIIELKEENVSSLGELTEARQQSINTIIDVMSKKSDDYLSVDAMNYYYNHFYSECTDKKGKDILKYQLDNPEDDILNLLSLNSIFRNSNEFCRDGQAVKTAGDNFRMIDNNTIDIIVPYNEEASGIIDELNGKTTISQALELQRKAQQYTVSVYDYTFKKLAENDALNEIKVRQDEKVYIYALKKEFYNNATGLSTEGKPQEAMFV